MMRPVHPPKVINERNFNDVANKVITRRSQSPEGPNLKNWVWNHLTIESRFKSTINPTKNIIQHNWVYRVSKFSTYLCLDSVHTAYILRNLKNRNIQKAQMPIVSEENNTLTILHYMQPDIIFKCLQTYGFQFTTPQALNPDFAK